MGKEINHIHLQYDIIGADEYYEDQNREIEHPQMTMAQLGITYSNCAAYSIADVWYFYYCQRVPDPLPSFLTETTNDDTQPDPKIHRESREFAEKYLMRYYIHNSQGLRLRIDSINLFIDTLLYAISPGAVIHGGAFVKNGLFTRFNTEEEAQSMVTQIVSILTERGFKEDGKFLPLYVGKENDEKSSKVKVE